MSLFDDLVEEALKNQSSLAPLRMVVEKELLHHDILRVLGETGLLARLIFVGGTCLRACYGSARLSEDLDFTGGADFDRHRLAAMAQALIDSLQVKYGLKVEVSEPVRETGNPDTWKLKVQTRPGRKDLAAQRINIDVCAIPSYQVRPMLLRNPYGVEMGTSGLILQVESREAIFISKILAFALRPNRIKNRDLWDIAWLRQQSVTPAFELLRAKLNDIARQRGNFCPPSKPAAAACTAIPQSLQAFGRRCSVFCRRNWRRYPSRRERTGLTCAAWLTSCARRPRAGCAALQKMAKVQWHCVQF